MIAHLLYILLTLSQSRPYRSPPVFGEQRSIYDQKHFEYSCENNLKGFSGKSPSLNYNLDIVDGLHVLDDLVFIERINCSDKGITVYSTSNEIKSWKKNDVFSASSMWGCGPNLIRKVIEMNYEGEDDGFYKYYFKTENGTLQDVFKRARVLYKAPEESDEPNNTEEQRVPKEEQKNMKQSDSLSIDILTELTGKNFESRDVNGNVNYIEIKYRINKATDASVPVVVSVENLFSYDKDYVETKCTSATNHICTTKVKLSNDYSENFEGNVRVKTDYFMSNAEATTGNFYINLQMLFTKPMLGEIAVSSDVLNVEWYAPQRTITKYSKMTIGLYQKGYVYDSFILQKEVYISSLKSTLSISKVTEGGTYYLETELGGNKNRGNDFEIFVEPYTANKVIQIISPNAATIGKSGYYLDIKWTYQTTPSFSKINIYVYRDVWGLDPCIGELEGVSVTLKSAKILIPQAPSSTDYYVYITYNCNVFCDASYSEKFPINYQPVFTVTSNPVVNEETKTVSFSYKLSQTLDDYYVSMSQVYPNLIPIDLVLGSEKHITGTHGTTTTWNEQITFTNGSPFKIYLLFMYDCTFGSYLCKQERKEVFSVPYRNVASYNYEDGQVVKSNMNLFSYTCDSANYGNVSSSTFDKVCKNLKNVDFKITSDCKDCFMTIPFSLRNFALIIDYNGVYEATFDIDARIKLEMDVVNTIQIQIEKNYLKFLTTLPVPTFIPIPLGPIILEINIAKMNLYFGMDMQGSAFIQTETVMKSEFIVNFKFDSNNPNNYLTTLKTDISSEGPTTNVYGSVSAIIKPYFMLEIQTSINLVKQLVGLNTYLKIGVGFNVEYSTAPFTYTGDTSPRYFHLRSRYGPFITMTLEAKLLTYSLFKKPEFYLLDRQTKFTKYFIETSGPSTDISFIFQSRRIISINTNLYLSGLSVELGNVANKIMQQTQSSSYNAYKVKVELTNFYYKVSLVDLTKTSEDLAKKLKRFIIQGYLSGVTIPSLATNYPILYDVRQNLIVCRIDSCSECSLDESECSICVSGFALQSDGTCERCIAPQYESGGVCKDCESNQVYDYSTNTCNSCADGTIFVQGRGCVQCSEYNKVWDSTLKTCVGCSEPKVYDVQLKNCVTCLTPTYYNNGKCVGCSGEQVFMNGGCQDCPDRTVFNSATKSCDTCQPPTIYSGNKCVSCPSFNKVYDYYTATCVDCKAPLVYSNGECQECEPPQVYDYYFGKCTTCGNNTYYDTTEKKCRGCESPLVFNGVDCSYCQGNQYYDYYFEQCMTCEPPRLLVNGECNYCDYTSGYLNGECVECERPYFYKDYKCEKCPQGKYYYYGDCVDCENGSNDGFECFYCYYPEAFNGTGCAECVAPQVYSSTKKCVECVAPFFYDSGYCFLCTGGEVIDGKCYYCGLEDKIYDEKTKKCVSCDNGLGFFNGECLDCNEFSLVNENNVCYYCGPNTYYLNGECKTCPEGTTLDEYYGWCTCSESTEWFNGYQCISCTTMNAHLNATGECECDGDLGFSMIHHGCVSCDDYGLFAEETQCLCHDYDYWNGKTCTSCERDILGYISENGYCECWNSSYDGRVNKCQPCETFGAVWDDQAAQCMCSGDLGFFEQLNYCVDCSKYGLTYYEDQDYCVCDGNKIWDEFNQICREENGLGSDGKDTNSDNNDGDSEDFAIKTTVLFMAILLFFF